jgi:hypothetical protein
VIVPNIPYPDVYVLEVGWLEGVDLESLAGFVAKLDSAGGFLSRSVWCNRFEPDSG